MKKILITGGAGFIGHHFVELKRLKKWLKINKKYVIILLKFLKRLWLKFWWGCECKRLGYKSCSQCVKI